MLYKSITLSRFTIADDWRVEKGLFVCAEALTKYFPNTKDVRTCTVNIYVGDDAEKEGRVDFYPTADDDNGCFLKGIKEAMYWRLGVLIEELYNKDHTQVWVEVVV